MKVRSKQYRHRHKPYRMFLELLYGHFKWLRWETPTTFVVQTGPLGLRLRVPRGRVREYFEYLQRHRYVRGLDFETRGQIRGTVVLPKRLEKE